MKVGDRVWCTASAQQLHDDGFTERESTFLLHTYANVMNVVGDVALITFRESCNYDGGYKPLEIMVNKAILKVDTDPVM